MLYQTIVKMESYPWIQRDALLKHVSDVLYFAGEQLQEDILDKWKILQDQLTGSDFSEQLKRYIGMELHEGFFPNDLNDDKDWVLSKVHEFAEKAISNPTQLEMAYSWLTTKQIGKIYYFGYELGNLDNEYLFLERIIEEQRKAGEAGSSYFMTGYLNALSKRNEAVWEDTIDRISKDEILGKYISILVPINDKEVKRLLLVAKETHSVEIFERFRINLRLNKYQNPSLLSY